MPASHQPLLGDDRHALESPWRWRWRSLWVPSLGFLVSIALALALAVGAITTYGAFEKQRLMSCGGWQPSALADDGEHNGQRGSFLLSDLRRAAAAVEHTFTNVVGHVELDMPPAYVDVVPPGSRWDTMDGFRPAMSGGLGFSLVSSSGRTLCAAELSFKWQAQGRFEGNGIYISDAMALIKSSMASPLYALTLKAHFGKGYMELGPDGPVAVLPAYAHALCQGPWIASYVHLHGSLAGNGTFILNSTRASSGRVVDLYGRVMLAPAHARSTLPDVLKDPNLTVELLDKYSTSPVNISLKPVSSSTRLLAISTRSKARAGQPSDLLDWSEISPDLIVNVGKWLWGVLHGTVDIAQPDDFATGLPKGIGRDDWESLDGWHVREVVWHGGARNGLGMDLASFYLLLRQDCKGQYRGQGSYINNLQVHFFEVSQGLPWVSIKANVAVGHPFNKGSGEDPIAAVPFSVNFHFDSLFHHQTDSYDGEASGLCKFHGRFEWN